MDVLNHLLKEPRDYLLNPRSVPFAFRFACVIFEGLINNFRPRSGDTCAGLPWKRHRVSNQSNHNRGDRSASDGAVQSWGDDFCSCSTVAQFSTLDN